MRDTFKCKYVIWDISFGLFNELYIIFIQYQLLVSNHKKTEIRSTVFCLILSEMKPEQVQLYQVPFSVTCLVMNIA